MHENENLYFIAIIPPDKICDEITGFKKDLALRFESSEALKVIPHITLKAPFKLPVPAHATLLNWFRKLLLNSRSFNIELSGFGVFDNTYQPVIFVYPIITVMLKDLQKEIIKNFRNAFPGIAISGLELKFNPHITVAYRDLRRQKFLDAWAEYKAKNYEAVFEADSFCLLQHDRKKWNVIDTNFLRKPF